MSRIIAAVLCTWLFLCSAAFSADFHIALHQTHAFEGEGVWTKIAEDRGGETYSGIARNRWPDWDGWTIIDASKGPDGKPVNLDHAALAPLVDGFYKSNFWDTLNLDSLPDQDMANAIYDIGVNQGTRTVARYAQRFLNNSNNGGRLWPDISADGAVGGKTIFAMTSYLKKREKSSISVGGKSVSIGPKWVFIYWLHFQKGQLYWNLASKSDKQEKFFHGWSLRVIGEQAAVLMGSGILNLE